MSHPLHSLELLPDVEGQEAVRRDWRALRDAGLPSQQDHRGPTNRPHLTVVAAPGIDEDAERLAAELVGPLLPLRVRVAGIVLFGGPRVTVARAVDVGDELLAAVVGVRAAVPDLPQQGWLPHITLARRVPRSAVQHAVDAVEHEDAHLDLTGLRRWDPATRTATLLAGSARA